MVIALAVWLLGIQGAAGQNSVAPPVPGVVLEVTMPSGSVNRLTIVSGKHGSVGAVNGPNLDLAPTLRDDGSLELTVTAVIWDSTTNSTSTLEAEQHVLRLDETAGFADGTFPISVKWIGTVAMSAAAGSAITGSDADRCCVVCGSELTCGCHVVTPCGDCCGASCGCQDGRIKGGE